MPPLIGLALAAAYAVLVLVFALTGLVLRAIDFRGFLASAAVGVAILFGGGLSWFVLVATFFALGVALTWYKYGYKKELGGAQEKGGSRSWPNILANGGLAALLGGLQLLAPAPYLAPLFLGAISAAAADTSATEIGLLSRQPPRLVTRPGTEVPPGTSGGVTLVGFGGALAGAAVIGLMAAGLGIAGGGAAPLEVSLAGGFAGALADSLLGATAQRKGRCAACGKPTEALRHCGRPTEATGGVPFIENNAVNLAATVVGAGVSLALYLAL